MAYDDLIARRRATIGRGLDLRNYLNQRRRTLDQRQRQAIEPVRSVVTPAEQVLTSEGGTAGPVARSYEGKLESDDPMGTGPKLGAAFKSSVLGLPGTAYEFTRNMVTGTPEVEDVGRAANLGLAAKQIDTASKAGLPSSEIAKSLAPNPLSIAANLFTTAMLSELGIGSGKFSTATSLAGAVGGGLVGGPLGAAAGSVGGTVVGSLGGDFLGIRDNEETRDAVESLFGAGGYDALTNPIDYIRAQRAFHRWSREGVFRDPGYFDPDYDVGRAISEFDTEVELGLPGSIFDQPTSIFDEEDPLGLGDPFDFGDGDSDDSDVGGFTDPGGGFSGWS